MQALNVREFHRKFELLQCFMFSSLSFFIFAEFFCFKFWLTVVDSELIKNFAHDNVKAKLPCAINVKYQHSLQFHAFPSVVKESYFMLVIDLLILVIYTYKKFMCDLWNNITVSLTPILY